MLRTRAPRFASVLGALALSALLLAQPASAQQTSGEITVFAAASLTDAFREIAHVFQYENPEASLVFSFGGSSTLRTQLDQGARADVFASADELNVLATYPIALTSGSNAGGGEAFINFVLSPIGQAVLNRWGFLPPANVVTADQLLLPVAQVMATR